MTKNNTLQQDNFAIKKFIYVAIFLLVINFILVFLPFIEVYQPSYKKIVLGVTTYGGWGTTSAPMAIFIFPLLTTAIPYLIALIGLLPKLRKKSSFTRIVNVDNKKPVRLFWLKFAAITNLIMMWKVYTEALDGILEYMEHGAYCNITSLGWANVIFTIIFIVVLFLLSNKSKKMLKDNEESKKEEDKKL